MAFDDWLSKEVIAIGDRAWSGSDYRNSELATLYFTGWLGGDVHILIRLLTRGEFASQIESYLTHRVPLSDEELKILRASIETLLDEFYGGDSSLFGGKLKVAWQEGIFKDKMEEALNDGMIEFLSPVWAALGFTLTMEGVLTTREDGVVVDKKTIVRKLQDGILTRKIKAPRGAPRMWTNEELLKELSSVVISGANLTWDDLARDLNERHPSRKVFTSEALRKRCNRAGITMDSLLKRRRSNRKRTQRGGNSVR